MSRSENKPRYLITQSLLAAWQYVFDCREEKSEEARESFLAYLRREPAEAPDAMLRGIAFENAVIDALGGDSFGVDSYAEAWAKRGKEDEERACVEKIAELVRGGAYQTTVYLDKTIAGEDFKLMAKCDWIRAGVIYDVKRVENYEVGKYYNSPQHPMYLTVIPEAYEFKYLIADGEEVYTERYTREDIPQSAESLISEFVAFLKSDSGLWKIYSEKWICA